MSRNALALLFALTTAASLSAQQRENQEPPKPLPRTDTASTSAPRDPTMTKFRGKRLSRECPSCDLRGLDFSNRDLSNANLSGADLSGANLTNATLRGTALVGANLTGAILTNAILDSSPGRPTNLTGANLTQANLSGARMNGTILAYANLTCTDLSNTDVRTAHFGPTLRIDQGGDCRTSFRNARLSCEFRNDWKKLDTTRAQLPSCQAMPPSTYYCGAARVSTFTNVIYVSATLGTDRASCGTSLSQQCQTIGTGISRCTGTNCNVLVDYNSYSPATTITLADGVGVYGGCATLSRPDPTYFSLINAPSGGAAGVSAVNTQTAMLFQGFTIMGSKAVAGAVNLSSVGFISQRNAALTLAYVTISAGAGGNGIGGANGVAGNPGPSASGQTAGTNCYYFSNGGTGAPPSTVATNGYCCDFLNFSKCMDCTFRTWPGSSGQSGSTGTFAAGGGPASSVCYTCPHTERPGTAGNGIIGSAAGCGTIGGASSPNITGSMQNGVWTPSAGAAGVNGGNGGGGGGGGGGGSCAYMSCVFAISTYAGVAGGGGGAGGCGGSLGGGGQQGGVSIALSLNQGSLTLDHVSLIGGTGGNGGRGGVGAPGGVRGNGSSVPSSNPCNDTGGAGGTGGKGGTGGASSGGAGGNGGPAYGLMIADSLSKVIETTPTTYSLGTSGAVGALGAGGTQAAGGICAGANGSPGIFGMVANIQIFYHPSKGANP